MSKVWKFLIILIIVIYLVIGSILGLGLSELAVAHKGFPWELFFRVLFTWPFLLMM